MKIEKSGIAGTIVKLVGVGMLLLACLVSGVNASTYFVATTGNDGQNTGSSGSPWATVAKGMAALKAGDTLYLRGGTYYESGLISSLQGSANAKIIIASYPGEKAEVCVGFPDFEKAPTTQWQVVDATKHIYRSTKTFTQSYLGGWLLDYDVQLFQYHNYYHFAATGCNCGTDACYAGPGIFVRNGHVEIRLEPNPDDLKDCSGKTPAQIPADLNPNNNSIRIFGSTCTMVLQNAAYLVFRNIKFSPGDYRTIDITGTSHHIELDGCDIRLRAWGVVIRETASNVEIHNCFITTGFPWWASWGDIKVNCKPLWMSIQDGYNSRAICAGTDELTHGGSNNYIHHNTFRDNFINVTLGGSGTRVMYNLFIRPHETFHIAPLSKNLEVAYNVVRHGLEFVGKVPYGNTSVGDCYFHHNVVDLTDVRRIQRNGNTGGQGNTICGPGWNTWGWHDCDATCDQSSWKIYNNTIIGKNITLQTWGSKHVEYNNIFYNIGSSSFEACPGQDCAGNAYWRSSGSNSTGESQGLAVNPLFNDTAFLKEDYSQKNVEEAMALYRPGQNAMFTAGKSYAGLSWPGVSGIDYRGAVPKEGTTGTMSQGPSLEMNLPSIHVKVQGSSIVASVTNTANAPCRLSLYRTDGKCVWHDAIGAGKTAVAIPISTLAIAQGMYWLAIERNGRELNIPAIVLLVR